MTNDLTGTRLGKYEIRAEIGRGGMGTVYKGYDPGLDRYVAVKVLAPHLVWKEKAIDRFLREARAAARLKHPNVVTIYDVGQEGDWYYFAMEYLEGQSLTEILRQRGALPPNEVVSILRPVAKALDYAHSEGLVHRDIKPGNILVGSQGQVTLTDFGIVHAAQETRLTSTGTLVGTPEYMSPEQAKSMTVDAHSDQYSLAVVAYEMLGGRVPFFAESPFALLYKVTHDPLPPIREARPELPPGVERVLAKALAKEPSDRYPTVSAFVDVLERALAGEVVEGAPVQPKAAAPPVEAPTLVREPGAAATPIPGVASRAARPAKPAAAPTAKPSPTRQRVPLWAWIVGGVAALVLVIGVVMGLSGTGGGSIPMPTTEEKATAVIVPGGGEKASTPSPSPPPTTAATRTATPVPAEQSTTPTSQPTPTPTTTPTPVPETTPTTVSQPTSTPMPRATAPQLAAPAQGGEYQSPVTFQWSGLLSAGQAYQVTAYHTESGHPIQSGALTAQSWTTDLPSDRIGEWRWSVSVVQGGSAVATSSEWMFWFNPFPGSGEDEEEPQPEPTRENSDNGSNARSLSHFDHQSSALHDFGRRV